MLPVYPNPHDNFTREELSKFSKFFIVEQAISDKQCDELVEYGKNNSFDATEKHSYGSNFKLKHCFLRQDNPIHESLKNIWIQSIFHFQFDVKFVEPYKLQFYEKGSHFQGHIDNYHGLDHLYDRKLSMSLQLTDENEYEGGNLIIGHKKMPRKKGTIIIFPSFYPHSVDPVTRGDRWVLITWAWGPYWK